MHRDDTRRHLIRLEHLRALQLSREIVQMPLIVMRGSMSPEQTPQDACIWLTNYNGLISHNHRLLSQTTARLREFAARHVYCSVS
ncbi:MAG TPA: hypothetical protein VGN07_23475 [Steroidobacteraceae bacterium]|jgi:hypothetical protein